jgi:hypothetical protein
VCGDSERGADELDDVSVLTEDRRARRSGGGRATALRERFERKSAAKAKRKERKAAKEDSKVRCPEG